MRIFKTRTFARFVRKEKMRDAKLIEAVTRAEQGLVDANLGGNIIKQRVARRGQGRRGGYRTLIAFRSGEVAIFMFGFAKNERDNIESDELTKLQLIAGIWLSQTAKVEMDVEAGNLIEVKDGKEN